MSKVCNFFIIVVAILLASIGIAYFFLKDSKLSREEYQILQHVISSQRDKMPIPIGSVGEIADISIVDDTIVWNFITYGGQETLQNYSEIDGFMNDYAKFIALAMCNNPTLSKFLEYDLQFKFIYNTKPPTTPYEFVITHEELKNHIQNSEGDRLESLCEAINMDLNDNNTSPVDLALSQMISSGIPMAVIEDGQLIIVVNSFDGEISCTEERMVPMGVVFGLMKNKDYAYFNGLLKACNISTYVVRFMSDSNPYYVDVTVPIIK